MNNSGYGQVLPQDYNFLDAPLEQSPEEMSDAVDCPPSGDPRLTRLSYSGATTLHGCPRKFQLQRLRAKVSNPNDWKTELTFQFGHSVGDAVADTLEGKTQNEVLFKMFKEWKGDILEYNPKQEKSLAHAVYAMRKFWALQEEGFFQDYELVYFNGRPAIELSFRITFPGNFTLRGYVDLVVRNKITGEYVIVENKTSSGKYLNTAAFKNSAQAIGYSVVLDKIVPGLTSYTVEYLVWMTQLGKWENFSFPKTYTQRALWIRDRMWDNMCIERLIQEEGSYGIWPMQGEHCTTFGKVCEYMDTCHLSTEGQFIPLKQIHMEEELDRYGKDYDFSFTIEDLLENSL